MQQVVLPDCPPPHFAIAHSAGASVLIRTANRGMRWFDRMVLTSPMLHLAQVPLMGLAVPVARTLHLLGFGSLYVPGGSAAIGALQPFAGNVVTSDPVRYTRAASVIEVERALGLGSPTIAWADAALRAMAEFAHPTYAAHIRQPILVLAAGHDQITSTRATEEFAIHLRAGAHLVVAGARHEIMMEQDIYRGQFWAAFDAFVPGTPAF
jgi:lysophospholipase